MFNFCYLIGKKEGGDMLGIEPGYPSTVIEIEMPLGVRDARMDQDQKPVLPPCW